MSEVLTLGECMMVLRGERPGRPGVGSPFVASTAGAEATVAIGLARLGHGSCFLGRVGDDDAGAMVLESLRGSGVDVRGVVVDSGAPTGLLLRWARTSTLTSVAYYRAGSAGSRLTADDLGGSPGPGSRLVHTTGITTALGPQARSTALQFLVRARERGVRTSFDVNQRHRLWSVEEASRSLAEVLPLLDVLFLGTDETDVLAGAVGGHDPVQAALAAGVSEVVVKDGARGARTFRADGQWSAPAVAVGQVVDPVGAGDAFAAGYLSALLDGLGPADRLRRGVGVAAFTVSTDGDWEGLPTRAELAGAPATEGTTLR